MKTFEYTIKAKDGLHARPAGALVNEAKKFACEIIAKKDDKEASVKKLFALMKLGVKQNDKIIVTFDGADEEDAYKVVTAMIGENF